MRTRARLAATWATCLISPNRSSRAINGHAGWPDRQRPTRLGKLEPLPGLDQLTGVANRLGEFLHEQRHAVRLFDNLIHDLRWQRLAAEDPPDELHAFATAKADERELGDMRGSGPAERSPGAR